MVKPTHIQKLGNSRVVLQSDGSKEIFYPTGTKVWLNGKPPFPETDFPKFRKDIVNPAVFIDFRFVAWAKYVGGNLVIGTSANFGATKIFYSTNNGSSFTESLSNLGTSVTWEWVKQIGNKLYVGPNLRISTNNGVSFRPIGPALSSLIGGIAFNPSNGIYIAIGSGEGAPFLPAGTSPDGDSLFTSYTPSYLHSMNGGPATVKFGLEVYNGIFYRTYGPHQHMPSTDLSLYGGMFSSATGASWNEFSISSPDLYVHGPLINVGPYLVSSPTIFRNDFRHLFGGTWDFALANDIDTADGELNSTADLIGGWVNYAHGYYWCANNFQREAGTSNPFSIYASSEICVANNIDNFSPYPVFSEIDWVVMAKCVDDNGDLLVFEKSNNGFASGPGVIEIETTRLVKIVAV